MPTQHPVRRKPIAAFCAALCATLALAPALHAQVAYAAAVADDAALATADAAPQARQSLSEVVVTAAGYEQAVEDAPASITVIGQEELQKKAYRDVTDALRDVPGVVITGGGSSSDISIRGMSSGYTMLLVDGRRQNSRETRPNSDGAGIEQGWLPPLAAIERIEVVRGPMSSLYGSDAMGGVVNIITRKVPQVWSGSVSVDGTRQGNRASGDSAQGRFFVGGPLKDNMLGLQVYGQKTHRSEDRFVNGFNRQEVTAGSAKLSLAPTPDHDVVLELGRTLQSRTATPGKSRASESCRGGECAPNAVSASHYDKNLYSLAHTGRWALGTSSTYVQREEIDNPARAMFLKNTEFNSQIGMPWDANLSTLGLSFTRENLRDLGNQLVTATPVQVLQRDQWALFAENEWSVTDAFALTAGLRMNHDENYGTHWTPRLYGVWHASEKWSLKGGISTGFKAPGLRAAVAEWGQITGGGGDPAVIVGNPHLKPETSASQEIGLLWSNRSNLDASLMLFNTDFKDKITEQRRCIDAGSNGASIDAGNCTIDGVAYKFISDRINVDKATMRGIESTLTWGIAENLRLAANYTFTQSRQKSGAFRGQPLNKIPRHMLNTTADWQINPLLAAWARMNLRGNTSDYLSRTRMGKGTPSFAFVDVGANWQVQRNTRLGAGIYNLFDKTVSDATHGAVYDGRRLWLNATVQF